MTRTYTTKWAKTCAERIVSGVMTEAELRKTRSILANAFNGERYGYHRGTTSCTPDDASSLMALLWEHPVQVSDEQARKGVEWLHNLAFTPKGKRRSTEAAAEFTDADLTTLTTCGSNPRFSLVDIDVDNGFAPVYRCHGVDSHFDYRAASWQSGGAFEIVARHHATT